MDPNQKRHLDKGDTEHEEPPPSIKDRIKMFQPGGKPKEVPKKQFRAQPAMQQNIQHPLSAQAEPFRPTNGTQMQRDIFNQSGSNGTAMATNQLQNHYDEPAKLLLHYDETRKCLIFDKTTLTFIKQSPEPFRLLAAVGDARIGKSSFLNGLTSICAEQANGSEKFIPAFSVGHEQTACTKGVWVKLMPLEDGTLIIMDVEGINLGDDKITIQLSLFTTLIASEIMLFAHKVLNNHAIKFLHHIAMLKDRHLDKVEQAQVANVCVTLQDPLRSPDKSLRDYIAEGLTRPLNNNDKLDKCREIIGKYIRYEDIKVLSMPNVRERDRRREDWAIRDEEYRESLELAAAGLPAIRTRTSLLGAKMGGVDIVDAMYRLVAAISTDEWDVWASSSMDFEERISVQANLKYIKPLLEMTDKNELQRAIPDALKKFGEKCKLDHWLKDAEKSLADRVQILELQEERQQIMMSRDAYDSLIKPLLENDMKSDDLEQKIPEILQKFKEQGALSDHVSDADTSLWSRVEVLKTKERHQMELLTKEAYETHILPLMDRDISAETLAAGIQSALQSFLDHCKNQLEHDRSERELKNHLEHIELREKLLLEKNTREAYKTHIAPLLGHDVTSEALKNAMPQAMANFMGVCNDASKVQEMRSTLESHMEHLKKQEEAAQNERIANCYALWITPLLEKAESSSVVEAGQDRAMEEYQKVCTDEKDIRMARMLLKFRLDLLKEKEKFIAEQKTKNAYEKYVEPLLQGRMSSSTLSRKIADAKERFESEGARYESWIQSIVDQRIESVKNEENEAKLQRKLDEERRKQEEYKNRSVWRQLGDGAKDVGKGVVRALNPFNWFS